MQQRHEELFSKAETVLNGLPGERAIEDHIQEYLEDHIDSPIQRLLREINDEIAALQNVEEDTGDADDQEERTATVAALNALEDKLWAVRDCIDNAADRAAVHAFHELEGAVEEARTQACEAV